MTKVGILFFSGYGHTLKQAEAVKEGVGEEGADVEWLPISQDGDLGDKSVDLLKECGAIIYGSPTYMGGPAWQFKRFADASSKLWSVQALKDKVAAGFTNSATTNGDKFSTLQYFWTLSQQHGQIWVGTGLMPSNKKEHSHQDINWTGSFGGAMSISPSNASPDEAPRKGDLETARALGKRVVYITEKLNS